MTPGRLVTPDSMAPPVATPPRRGSVLIKWQPVCARTREPLDDPLFSKSYAETLAERHTKRGRAAVVEKVEV